MICDFVCAALLEERDFLEKGEFALLENGEFFWRMENFFWRMEIFWRMENFVELRYYRKKTWPFDTLLAQPGCFF